MRQKIGAPLFADKLPPFRHTGILADNRKGKIAACARAARGSAKPGPDRESCPVTWIQAQQGDLDLLVTRGVIRALAHKVAYQQVGRAASQGERVDPAGGGVVRDARLDQVAVAVQLVLDLQVNPAHAGEVDLVVGEEVTVVRLGFEQQGEEGVHAGSQLRIRMKSINPGSCVQPLVCIRIGEKPALAKTVLLPGEDAKVVNAPAGFQLFPLMEDGALGIGLQARRPEGIVYSDLPAC